MKQIYKKIDCAEMFNAVKNHFGVSELRRISYSLYNYYTANKTDYLTTEMHTRLVDLYYTTFPSIKNEVPYNENVKCEWLETLTFYKQSNDFVLLSDKKKNKIELEIYRLKEMIN